MDTDTRRGALAAPAGTIARIRVVRGDTTEYPIAQRLEGDFGKGWQNGATFYPDADVDAVMGSYGLVPADVAPAPALSMSELGLLNNWFQTARVFAQTGDADAELIRKLRRIAGDS